MTLPPQFLFPNSDDFLWSQVRFPWRRAVEQGARRGLTMAGPLLRSPITGARFRFHALRLKRPSDVDATGAILTCAAELARRLVARCGTAILEPVMRVEMAVADDPDGQLFSRALSDLSQRRARIVAVNETAAAAEEEELQTVVASVPLAELVGYAGQVRKLTSGRAELHLQVEGYEPMDVHQQETLLQKLKY